MNPELAVLVVVLHLGGTLADADAVCRRYLINDNPWSPSQIYDDIARMYHDLKERGDR